MIRSAVFLSFWILLNQKSEVLDQQGGAYLYSQLLGRLRQGDHKFKGSLGDLEGTCLKKVIKRKKEIKEKRKEGRKREKGLRGQLRGIKSQV